METSSNISSTTTTNTNVTAITTTTRKNVCFIHSTMYHIWKDEVLLYLLRAIVESGLINQLSMIYINNIGDPLDPAKYKEIHESIIVQNFSTSLDLFENCTIKSLHQYAKIHPDTNILYMHTKGISYEKNNPFVVGIFSWMRYMMYCLIHHHTSCLSLLEFYDTVGTNFRPFQESNTNPDHYSGNFWWARSDYVSKLPVHHLKDKYHAEFWLLDDPAKEVLHYNCFSMKHMYEFDYPIESYKDVITQQYKEQVLYCRFGAIAGVGLCNQLYSLVNVILMGVKFPGFATIIVGDFLTDIHTNQLCDPSTIIDFSHMNKLLLSYKVKLVKHSSVKMEITKVTFGRRPHVEVDITNPMIEHFYNDNVFYIPPHTNINEFCPDGDPLPNVPKQLYVEYTVDGRPMVTMMNEVIEIAYDQACLDFKTHSMAQWYSRTNIIHSKSERWLFNYLLENVRFNEKYYNVANLFVQNLQSKINVIHLRLEDDALDFWGMINNIPRERYEQVLEQKYIRLIQEHISKDSTTILLTMKTDNRVTQYMASEGYPYVFMDKTTFEGREVNGIVDLLISECCNGVFIGNINPYNFHGSTFSYAIYNKLKNKNVKKICIDSDRIFDKEYIEM